MYTVPGNYERKHVNVKIMLEVYLFSTTSDCYENNDPILRLCTDSTYFGLK